MRPPLLLLAAALAGCAAKPVLYPNPRFSEDDGKSAIEECRGKADAYVKNQAAKKAAGEAVEGAAIGAAAGAVTGAMFGSVGRGAASGGAAGAAVGLVRGLFRARQPSPVKRAYVDRCLRERGFDVLGWE